MGLTDYINEHPENYPDAIIATDVVERADEYLFPYDVGPEYDFLSDGYKLPIDTHVDYIIMNPPYATIEPHVIRALEIAERGVLMLGRLQFLEGKGRYENILKDNPPTDVYIYVDRIKCLKNGDPSIPVGAVQAYAWFYWDLQEPNRTIKKGYNDFNAGADVYLVNPAYRDEYKTGKYPILHWIRRVS